MNSCPLITEVMITIFSAPLNDMQVHMNNLENVLVFLR